jgi:hypothetical protein
MVAGCGGGSVDCGSADALETVIPIFQEQIERRTGTLVRSEDGERMASSSEIRAAVRQATFAVEDVRTSNRDPNSTKRFCSGTLVMTFPASVVESAERTRQLTSQDDVESLADRNNVTRQANRFEADIEYSVQPTDDGGQVFAEVQDADSVFAFAAELIASHLLGNEVQQARSAEEAALAEQRQAEAQQIQEQEAAAAEQQAATLAQARSDLQLAEQLINTVWQNIPASTRRAMLEEQRGWLRMKTADCRVEAASASIDPQEREVARLRCEARLNRDRSGYLRRFVGVEAQQPDMNGM